jgi:hypothetical protein
VVSLEQQVDVFEPRHLTHRHGRTDDASLRGPVVQQRPHRSLCMSGDGLTIDDGEDGEGDKQHVPQRRSLTPVDDPLLLVHLPSPRVLAEKTDQELVQELDRRLSGGATPHPAAGHQQYTVDVLYSLVILST